MSFGIRPDPPTPSSKPTRTTKHLCFVIGPIGAHKSPEREHADKLLKLIIKPTFGMHFRTFKVQRADEIARPGMIDSQVISHLIEADLVVADLTTRNANAFYELGIRHMLQKPVIHMFRRGDPPPADVAPYRGIEFSYEGKWDIRDAKILLRRTVSEVLSSDFQIENPVTRSAGFLRMEKVANRDRDEFAKLAERLKAEVGGTQSSKQAQKLIERVASLTTRFLVG
jgi:hypothetical protein